VPQPIWGHLYIGPGHVTYNFVVWTDIIWLLWSENWPPRWGQIIVFKVSSQLFGSTANFFRSSKDVLLLCFANNYLTQSGSNCQLFVSNWRNLSYGSVNWTQKVDNLNRTEWKSYLQSILSFEAKNLEKLSKLSICTEYCNCGLMRSLTCCWVASFW
jgi:hypothetical protein